MERCDEDDDQPVHCKQHKQIQIREADVFQVNSDNNYENIDDKLRHQCKRLIAPKWTIGYRCNRKHVCRNEHNYRDWNDCLGLGNLTSRPIVLGIAFECVSRKYLFSSDVTMIIYIYGTIS